MISNTHHGGLVIFSSISVALVLMILPLPQTLALFKPDIVTLVLIYWWLALPERVGITTAFISGLVVDAITGTMLGQHALTFSTVAYVTLQFHQRVRVYPLWQQSLVVILLLYMEQILTLWLRGMVDLPVPGRLYWITPLIGGLLWPWLFIILRDLRRRFQVS